MESIVRAVMATVLGVGMVAAPSLAAGSGAPKLMDRAALAAILADARVKFDLPAVAAAVVIGDHVTAAAIGSRKYGGPSNVTDDDVFHIGSDTKAMTATVAAMLVEQGKLSWTTTLAEAFPDLKRKMLPAYRSVTLLELLSHHAGLPGDGLPGGIMFWRTASEPLRTQRHRFVAMALREKPLSKPGTQFAYSNWGYIIVGAMIEKVTGEAWETAIRKMLFEPLGMKSAGFGSMRTDEPWPHVIIDGKPQPVPPGPFADNPPVLGPAGTVHCSVGDLAKFVWLHLEGEGPHARLLKSVTFKKLHTPPFGGIYALGWGVADRPWANGKALTHAGSNTMNYTVEWLAPDRDFAIIVDTNEGGDKAAQACDAVATAVIGKCLGNYKMARGSLQAIAASLMRSAGGWWRPFSRI